MADTIPDTPLTDGIYIDVYDATSIVVGTEILVQNKSNKIVFLHSIKLPLILSPRSLSPRNGFRPGLGDVKDVADSFLDLVNAFPVYYASLDLGS